MRRQTRRKCTKCALGLQELLIYPRSLFTRSGRDPSGTSLPHEGFLRHLWTNDALADETVGQEQINDRSWSCSVPTRLGTYPTHSPAQSIKSKREKFPNQMNSLDYPETEWGKKKKYMASLPWWLRCWDSYLLSPPFLSHLLKVGWMSTQNPPLTPTLGFQKSSNCFISKQKRVENISRIFRTHTEYRWAFSKNNI